MGGAVEMPRCVNEVACATASCTAKYEKGNPGALATSLTWNSIPEGTRERRTQCAPCPMGTLRLQAWSRVQRDSLDVTLTQHVHDEIRDASWAISLEDLCVFSEEERRPDVQRGTLGDSNILNVVFRNENVATLEQHSVGSKGQ
jgi:hypothetical protein